MDRHQLDHTSAVMSSIVSLLVLIRTAPTANPLPTEIWIVVQSALSHECAYEGAYDVKSCAVNSNCVGYIINDCVHHGLGAEQPWVVVIDTSTTRGKYKAISQIDLAKITNLFVINRLSCTASTMRDSTRSTQAF